MLRLALPVLCSLAGALWAGPKAAPRSADPVKVADPLHQLRAPIHDWLARDIDKKTLAENRAYADLVLAFGSARAGDPDGAKKLLREAAVLEKGDAVHQCLLGLYRHRIEQVLGGEAPTGPLPAKLLARVTPTGTEPVNDPIKLNHYMVLRARELSRIITPAERVDPYLPWTSKTGDPLVGRLGALQDEVDPERFARGAEKLLKDSADGSIETRLRVTTGLAALAPRAGAAFGTELLKGVPELARAGRKEAGEQSRAGAAALVEQALALATSLKKPELFDPLVAEAVELIDPARGASAPATAARLMVRCEQGFRVMDLREGAKAFLKGLTGKLPVVKDAPALRNGAGNRWPEAAQILLAEAGVRRCAGQGAEADKLLAIVKNVVLDAPADERSASYYRLVAEYAAACGRLSPADAKRALEELFTKLARVPDTYTTATHYSRYHLMILEAAVLGLTDARK